MAIFWIRFLREEVAGYPWPLGVNFRRKMVHKRRGVGGLTFGVTSMMQFDGDAYPNVAGDSRDLEV
jgi:hypothetical protein